MTAKQRRFERTVVGYLERLERKLDVVCKAAGIDPDTLIDLDSLRAIEDNAEGDQGFDAGGEELQPEVTPLVEPEPPIEQPVVASPPDKAKPGKAKTS